MSDFQFEEQETERGRVLRLSGHLDSGAARRLELELRRLIQVHHPLHLAINFSGVAFLSSAGMGAVVSAFQSVREMRGDIKLVQMRPNVKRVFDLLGFGAIYEVYASEEEALASFPGLPESDQGSV